jgi:hypothetical protein
MNSRTIPLVRGFFGLLTLVAIAAQLKVAADAGVLNLVNFFSYFTIQSNLLSVAVFILGALGLTGHGTRRWDLIRGQAVVMMTVTYVVFALLLADTDVDVAVPWVNTVVHTIMPLAVIADWLIDPPQDAISPRTAMVWLAFPLLWTAYTLVRGALVGWYPYPFLDPANGGYGTVALYVVGIFIFGSVVSVVVAVVGSALRSRRIV